MAQEVIRDWIYRFDQNYVDRVDGRASENSLVCRSCNIPFENNDIVYSQYKSRGSAVKRHVQCAILHHVIDIHEAMHIAPKELAINWKDIRVKIPIMLEQRRKMFTSRLALLALAVAMFGVNFINSVL